MTIYPLVWSLEGWRELFESRYCQFTPSLDERGCCRIVGSPYPYPYSDTLIPFYARLSSLNRYVSGSFTPLYSSGKRLNRVDNKMGLTFPQLYQTPRAGVPMEASELGSWFGGYERWRSMSQREERAIIRLCNVSVKIPGDSCMLLLRGALQYSKCSQG